MFTEVLIWALAIVVGLIAAVVTGALFFIGFWCIQMARDWVEEHWGWGFWARYAKAALLWLYPFAFAVLVAVIVRALHVWRQSQYH